MDVINSVQFSLSGLWNQHPLCRSSLDEENISAILQMINKSNSSFLETELETPQNVIAHAKPWETNSSSKGQSTESQNNICGSARGKFKVDLSTFNM